MDVAALIARLGTVPGLAQVIEATSGDLSAPTASSAELGAILEPICARFPISMREQGTAPSVVYTLDGLSFGQVDGFSVTQTDEYVLVVRAAEYDDLLALITSILAALDGSSMAFSLVPDNAMRFGYDDALRQCAAEMRITCTYLPSELQTLPAAMVYFIGRFASPTDADNFVEERMVNRYGIVLVTDGDLDSLLDSVMVKLLGFQIDEHEQFIYETGDPVPGVTGLKAFREIYSDAEFISEAI